MSEVFCPGMGLLAVTVAVAVRAVPYERVAPVVAVALNDSSHGSPVLGRLSP